ncbi:MAG: hypothetical protein ACTH0V_03205 [Microbacteriaceae bacterium]
MNAGRLIAATVASAIYTLGIQIIALLALAPADFGLFSVMYLVAALGLSVQYSAISEAWVRSGTNSPASDWASFSSTTLYFAGAWGLGAAVLALFIPGIRSFALLVGLSVAASIYRAGARFYSLHGSRWRAVLPADVLGAVGVVIAAVLVIALRRGDLLPVMIAWAATSLVTAVASRPAQLRKPSVVHEWARAHGASAIPLLRDSLVMDAASIGTPYALVPLLGIGPFGVYRAVSNVAAPVRLLLNPLRPRIAALSEKTLRSGKTLALIAALSVVMGSLATAALAVLSALSWDLGTLNSLSTFAVPTGLFVAANMFGHAHYLIARQRSPGRLMLIGRLVQTILAIVLPIGGAIIGGLPFAIWAYALATTGSSLTWAYLVRRRS